MRWRIYRVIFCITLMLVWTGLAKPWQYLPPAWNPGVALSITHPINPVTRWKLAKLKTAPQQCLDVLASVPKDAIDYLALADYTPVESCPLQNVVRVHRTGMQYNTSFTMACPLLVRWLMFEQQKLQPLALEHFDSKVRAVEHYGTFACRNVNSRTSGRRSQHATAFAFDVAGFELENGEVVSVLHDWDNEQAPVHREFLHEVHAEACAYFGTVLGPEYNRLHANHFHLDTGSFNLCR